MVPKNNSLPYPKESLPQNTKAAFIIFPKLETRFNTNYQNVHANAFRNVFLELLRLLSTSIAIVWVARKALSLRSCIAQFDPWSKDHAGRAPLRKSVGDINVFQNDFAFIISTETCFSRFRSLFSAFLTPSSKQLCVYRLQKSPWKSFGNLNSTPEVWW